MATLYFMRHAVTEMNINKLWSGRTDCDITEEGRKIAIKCFNSQVHFTHFFCSPLRRTRQTLEAVIPSKPEPIIDERLIERDFGDWEGKPFSIIDEETTEMYIRGKVQPPNGETYEEVKDRVISFVEDMFRKYNGKEKILIVTHATIVRMVRDVFLPETEKGPIKNAQLIVLKDNK